MSDNIDSTPEARWRKLREEGPHLLVNLSSNDPIQDKPTWLDEARFARAKAAIQKHYIGVAFSSFTGLLLILQLPDGLEPLLVTGNSKDIPALYKRYLNTILHVNSWYDDDIFNPETKGFKSIRQVRSMHRRVQQLMNDKYHVKDLHGQPHSWMTQYDVALTQFAFIGLAMLFPRKSAMIAASKEDLESINYYWRVLGWFMGMQDEFNACQFDKYEDIEKFMRLIFEHEYMAKFKEQPCKMGLDMTQAICKALQYYMPLVTFNSLAYWWKDCFTFNGYEMKPRSVRDRALNLWTSVSFNQLLKSDGFLKFSVKMQKKRFEQRLKRKDIVYNEIKDKYKDCPQWNFYSDRNDYFNKSTLDKENQTDNDKNNNSEGINSELTCKQMESTINGTTFKGCPMGFDQVLPA